MGDRDPDVFVDEVPSAPRPIEGVGTAVAGFVGVAETGPTQGAYVHSWSDFADRWTIDSPLGTAVEDFFANGGSAAWIAPVSRLRPKPVRRAIAAMDRDVALVAVISDPAAPPDVVAAAAEALTDRRAMLLVEGRWRAPDEAIAEMSAGRTVALGAVGPSVAVYWPRIRRPVGAGVIQEVSPLGAVAGVIARTDATRGVFAAPAGTDAVLRRAVEPSATATPAELESLNELGVNMIRHFAAIGTVVWGARTQAADVEWKYVPVRRTLLFLEESIVRGLEWVIFEPNDEALWRTVRAAVEEFLTRLFRQGAFAGSKPEHAFFVKCDGTTMTHDDIDRGRLVCLIGVAPTRPAEFLVFRVTRWTADADE